MRPVGACGGSASGEPVGYDQDEAARPADHDDAPSAEADDAVTAVVARAASARARAAIVRRTGVSFVGVGEA